MKYLFDKILKTAYLRNILIVSIFVAVAFPIIDKFVIYPQFSGFLIANTEEEAVRTATHLSHELAPGPDGITHQSLSVRMIENAQEISDSLDLMKFKVFSKSGETIFSTDDKDVGVVNKNGYFFDTVAAGHNFTKLVRKDSATLEGQVIQLDVVETYVPVLHEGKFAGAFEIYYDVTQRMKAIDRLFYFTSLILVAVGLVLLIATFWAVKSAAEATVKRDLARAAMVRANKNLEDRVIERTRDLSIEKDRADFANKSKSEFLANMSHELRTPLNSVIAYSETLLRETFGPLGSDKNTEYVTDIHKSGQLLLEHITDILDIAKIETGEQDMDETVVNVPETLTSLIAMVKLRARDKNINLVVNSNVDSLTALLDERRFKQIVLNLLSNAIKFTPAGGQVILGTEVTAEKEFLLTVKDTGIGIAAGDIQRVQEPFVQVADSQTRAHEGTGLGLAIVKSLVGHHDGQLFIISEEGVGTEVAVLFPARRIRSYELLDPITPSASAAG